MKNIKENIKIEVNKHAKTFGKAWAIKQQATKNLKYTFNIPPLTCERKSLKKMIPQLWKRLEELTY